MMKKNQDFSLVDMKSQQLEMRAKGREIGTWVRHYPPGSPLLHGISFTIQGKKGISGIALHLGLFGVQQMGSILVRNWVSRSALKPWRPQPTWSLSLQGRLRQWGLVGWWDAVQRCLQKEAKGPSSHGDENVHGGGGSAEEHKGPSDSY